MRVFEFIDFIQRRINSVLFRAVILLYSFVILFIYPEYINITYYLIGIILYFVIYIYLLKKPRLRLINDFGFITFMLFGKNPNDIILFVFLILPIFNSINFSGKKKSRFLYIYTSTIYLGLLCFFNHRFELDFVYSNILPILSLIFLWIIDFYTSFRSKIRTFRETLNEVVDSFYLDKEILKKPHKIYKALISAINRDVKSKLIEDLLCFTIVGGRNDKVVIVNGSKFIWRYELDEIEFIKKIREKGNLNNFPMKIDDMEHNSNLSILIQIENFEYVFTFITQTSIPIYYLLIGLFRTLEPALSKMAKILVVEKRLQEIKNEELMKLAERSQYVNRANKTMHFIRNRLGPISNLIAVIENFDMIPPEKKKEFKAYILNEKERAKIELTNITSRANYLLEKSNNPLNFTDTSKFSVESVFSILKRNFMCFFPDNEIKISETSSELRRCVMLNEEGFLLLLSDWLNNIKKYKKDFLSAEFILTREELIIIFSNDFNDSMHSIKNMISDLKSDDRNEIMKRTTHGLYQIKTILEDMSVAYDVYLNAEKTLVIFKIIFKIIENEDSHI